MKIALAQINPTVGDVVGNANLVLQFWKQAAQQGADLVLAPELVLAGYPVEDLVTRPSFIEDIRQVVDRLAAATAGGPPLLLGAPWREDGCLYNAALLLSDGEIAAKVFKRDLPNYGPFDEKRFFARGPVSAPIAIGGVLFGVLICEDMWKPETARELRRQGAQALLVLNGSPYESEKLLERQAIARARVMENELPLIYLNLVGGQDDLIFDGASFVLDATGTLKAQAPAFEEALFLTEWQAHSRIVAPLLGPMADLPDGPAIKMQALTLGIRDYVRKNGFTDVTLGLSGGIDSALVAALAVRALGPSHVHALLLPSVFTSRASIDDAMATAKALGLSAEVVPIIQAVRAFREGLAPILGKEPEGLTHENIQARCRGLFLMAQSNEKGYLLLATGNKSELATGYATLYGDMCGAYAPLKDLYKTEVYKVARHLCGDMGPVIPEAIFTKAPSAELRPNQTDQDSLPPYDELDEILQGLVECDMSFAMVVEQGHDLALVKRIWMLLQRSEYKRRQAPPGPKLTRRHLGRDRRYPVTNGYTGS